MAEFDFTLTARARLDNASLSIAGNRIAERTDLALVSVAVPLGGEAALAAALKAGWGLTMPEARMSSAAGGLRAVRTGPDQLLLMLPLSDPDPEAAIRAALNGTGYTTDQTDAWSVLEISGPEVFLALERLCPLDTSPESFAVGASARSMMEHMGVLILRTGQSDFLLLAGGSYAQSFLHAVETSFRYVVD